MVSTRKFVGLVPGLALLLTYASTASGSHAQSLLQAQSSVRSPQQCREGDPVRMNRGPLEGFGRLSSATETLVRGELCDDRGVEEHPAAVKEDDPPALTRQIDSPAGPADRQPFLPSIRASGQEADLIASARAGVLAILRSDNSCSAWFVKADSNVAETFSSLQFWIERDGPEHILQERGERGDWIWHGPYIARTSESTGAGTNIAINASGAFFRNKAQVFKIEWQHGLQRTTNTWQNLHAGPYDGATPKAQIITLLHELAHVVGAIPSDGMSPSGINRSEENTEVVLKHCRSAIDSSSKRTLIELAQQGPPK